MLSAVIASIFGVKGTIVGVAIGSIAATVGTALVFQSIERTNKAVKQVVVRVPDSRELLRRLGGTKAAGVTRSEPPESPLHEETETSAAQAGGTAEESGTAAGGEDVSEERTSLLAPAPAGLRWPLLAGVVVAVFVISLLLVTVVELIAGRPLADLFGHSGGGTTVEKIFESPTPTLPAPTTTTTSSSSTTTTSTSTTTSVVGTTTTSSSSSPGSTTTSSTNGLGTSTSTPATG